MQYTGSNTQRVANPVLGPSQLAIAGLVRTATLEPVRPVVSGHPGMFGRTVRGVGRLLARDHSHPGGAGLALAGFVRAATLGPRV